MGSFRKTVLTVRSTHHNRHSTVPRLRDTSATLTTYLLADSHARPQPLPTRPQHPQLRHISLLHKTITAPSTRQIQSDLDASISLVRQYDPSGYLPGLLLPTADSRLGYFAVRAFWVETGLRFTVLPGVDDRHATPHDKIQWYRDAVRCLYDEGGGVGPWNSHPTVRLLSHVAVESRTHALSREYLDAILDARQDDLDVKQYPTVSSLVRHSDQSCGSLMRLVLECADVPLSGEGGTRPINDAATEIGIAHGITNALRGSIPVASATGRIIIPEELCKRYGVRSPRYLLSALGMGDEQCRRALQNAVGDLVGVARSHLRKGRERREEMLASEDGPRAVSVLLPGLASETFLDRLEQKNFDLTDRNLRNVGFVEHGICASKMVKAWWMKTY